MRKSIFEKYKMLYKTIEIVERYSGQQNKHYYYTTAKELKCDNVVARMYYENRKSENESIDDYVVRIHELIEEYRNLHKKKEKDKKQDIESEQQFNTSNYQVANDNVGFVSIPKDEYEIIIKYFGKAISEILKHYKKLNNNDELFCFNYGKN